VPDLKSVPDEIKWRIAAQYSSHLTAMYEKVFRPVIKNRYDELEQEIWIEMTQFSGEIARSLKLPVETARELAESLSLIRTIVAGPDSREEVIEVGKDGAVIIIRRCPHLMNDSSPSSSGDGMFHRCMAFTLASQKQLNPDHSSRFVRTMCMGDRQCEIKIETGNKTGE
jgi:hypothetical protein